MDGVNCTQELVLHEVKEGRIAVVALNTVSFDELSLSLPTHTTTDICLRMARTTEVTWTVQLPGKFESPLF